METRARDSLSSYPAKIVEEHKEEKIGKGGSVSAISMFMKDIYLCEAMSLTPRQVPAFTVKSFLLHSYTVLKLYREWLNGQKTEYNYFPTYRYCLT